MKPQKHMMRRKALLLTSLLGATSLSAPAFAASFGEIDFGYDYYSRSINDAHVSGDGNSITIYGYDNQTYGMYHFYKSGDQSYNLNEANPTDDDLSSFYITGISDDGLYLYGADGPVAARYSLSDGLEHLDDGSLGYSTISMGSDDGSVLYGTVWNGAPQILGWTEETGAEILDTSSLNLSGLYSLYVQKSSADGSSVLFSGGYGTGASYIWKEGTGITNIDPVYGGFIYAYDMSANGDVVVGTSTIENLTQSHAFRWTEAGGTTHLGVLRQGDHYSEARFVSDAGDVIAGASQGEDQSVFRWTEATGMTDINPDSYRTYISGMSSDGDVLAGNYYRSGSGTSRAYRWTEGDGLVDLGTLQSENAENGYSYFLDMSDDGSTIIGLSSKDDDNMGVFVWREDTMIDHAETLAQVGQMAVNQGQVGVAMLAASEGALQQRISIRPGMGLFTRKAALSSGEALSFAEGDWKPQSARQPFTVRFSMNASSNPDDSHSKIAGVTAATEVLPDVELGAHLGLGQSSSSLDGFGVEGQIGTGAIFLRKLPQSNRGLSWQLGMSKTSADATITREATATATETGIGEADMKAASVEAQVSYTMAMGNDGIIAPYAGVTRSTYRRDGYTEKGDVTFPVTYDEYDQKTVFATLGLSASKRTGLQGVLTIDGGMEIDINRSENAVTGSSTIPGMTSFSVDAPGVEHDKRAFFNATYEHAFMDGSMIDVSVGVRQDAYSKHPSKVASIGYRLSF